MSYFYLVIVVLLLTFALGAGIPLTTAKQWSTMPQLTSMLSLPTTGPTNKQSINNPINQNKHNNKQSNAFITSCAGVVWKMEGNKIAREFELRDFYLWEICNYFQLNWNVTLLSPFVYLHECPPEECCLYSPSSCKTISSLQIRFINFEATPDYYYKNEPN